VPSHTPAARPDTSAPRTLVTHPELASQRSFPFFRTVGERPKSLLERALSVFADVRAGEGVGVLLLATNVFIILAGYSLLKPVRDALVVWESGPAGAARSAAIQAVVLMGVVPLFGWLGARVPRMTLITSTTLFFVSNLVLFWVGGNAGLRLGVVFYIWMGVFNVFIVAQFWAFANDLYTEGQGRRLFPIIGVGASLGAWVGAATVIPLARGSGFSEYALMLAAAGVFVVALGLTTVVNRREVRRGDPAARQIDEAPLGAEGAFALIRKDGYLLWIAVLTILLNVVNTTGQMLLNVLVNADSAARFGAGTDEARLFLTSFFATFQTGVNTFGLFVQLFLTSRAIRYFGVRGSLFVLPALALVNYSVIAVVPLLAVVRITKTLENGTDYSLQNTLRHALFLPTSREAKYKAKAAIDTFCARIGDLAAAGVALGGLALGLGTAAFAWINIGFTILWLGVASRIAREHRKKTT
jgi:ATP:ADP antiporter, AAA family